MGHKERSEAWERQNSTLTKVVPKVQSQKTKGEPLDHTRESHMAWSKGHKGRSEGQEMQTATLTKVVPKVD